MWLISNVRRRPPSSSTFRCILFRSTRRCVYVYTLAHSPLIASEANEKKKWKKNETKRRKKKKYTLLRRSIQTTAQSWLTDILPIPLMDSRRPYTYTQTLRNNPRRSRRRRYERRAFFFLFLFFNRYLPPIRCYLYLYDICTKCTRDVVSVIIQVWHTHHIVTVTS